jgi:hypothetical protein
MSGAAPAEPVTDEKVAKMDKGLSMLDNLKSRAEEIKNNSVTVIEVPRWKDPVIKVAFKPVDHGIIKKGIDTVARLKGQRKSDAEVNANIDVLVAGCVEVFAEINGQKYSLRRGDHDGEPTQFDADLAENLDCAPNARAVVKALYIFEGDIIITGNAVAEFSGYKEQDAEEQLLGE